MGRGLRPDARGGEVGNGYIEVESGVSVASGEAFCVVRCYAGSDTDGRLLSQGQVTPSVLRTMALWWLEIAEAAEQDAATLATCRALELPDQMAGMIVEKLRARRSPA